MPEVPELVQEQLIKTKRRVTDHGEVFTPTHIVETMLDLVKDESERIDSRFLEPACGEGNFLRQVLLRKLSTVQTRYGKNEFERRHYALLALMSIYGIEILEDNVEVCQENLMIIFTQYIDDMDDKTWARAARQVLRVNIVHANALTMSTSMGDPLSFPEWGYLGKGKYQRRDFQYSNLTQRSSFSGTLFDGLELDDIFTPRINYKPMTVKDIANLGVEDGVF